MIGAFGADPPKGRRLYGLTLLGDLGSNAAYFALVATQPAARAVETGTLLGIVAGVGAVVLPPRFGLSAVTTSRTTVTQLLTVGLYAAGGLVAGVVYRSGSPET